METVVLQSLSKTYSGGKLAVRQVSLSLNQGEVFGFLGPNGAGQDHNCEIAEWDALSHRR